VQLEGLGQLQMPDELICNRSHDLPVCNTVSQPTMLPHAHIWYIYIYNIKSDLGRMGYENVKFTELKMGFSNWSLTLMIINL
jgi:hypothetical protein